jgi:hypothetical protein
MTSLNAGNGGGSDGDEQLEMYNRNSMREPYSPTVIPITFIQQHVVKRFVEPAALVDLKVVWPRLTPVQVGEWLNSPYLYFFEVPGQVPSTYKNLVAMMHHFGVGFLPRNLRGYFLLTWEAMGYGPIELIKHSPVVAPQKVKTVTCPVFIFCTSIRTCKAVKANETSAILGTYYYDHTVYQIHLLPLVPFSGVCPTEAFSIPSLLEHYFLSEILDKYEGRGISSALYHDFTHQPYYEEHMSSYSSLTFVRHSKQLRGVLAEFKTLTAVAPGDGLGVVATLASELKMKYVGGDVVIRASTHPMVEKATLMETFRKADLIKNPLVILSYVWSFLSEAERKEVLGSPHPLLILDSHLIPCPTGEPIGPTCWFRPGGDARIPPAIEVPTEYGSTPVSQLLFTENLLNLPSLEYSERSEYVAYYTAMRPLSIVRRVVEPTGKFPFIVHTINEYLIAARRGWTNLYVACLGLIDPEVVHLQAMDPGGGKDLKNVLRTRKIYIVPQYYWVDHGPVLHAPVPPTGVLWGGIFFFSSIASGRVSLYPVLPTRYAAIKSDSRRFVTDNQEDVCVIDFVEDGVEMVEEVVEFSRSPKSLIISYRGCEYRQNLQKNVWSDYLVFVLRFKNWEFGPAPSTLAKLLRFLKFPGVVDLPSYWTATSWKEYCLECSGDDLAVNVEEACDNLKIAPIDHNCPSVDFTSEPDFEDPENGSEDEYLGDYTRLADPEPDYYEQDPSLEPGAELDDDDADDDERERRTPLSAGFPSSTTFSTESDDYPETVGKID